MAEDRMKRRAFLAGAAAATLTIVKPGSARGAEANGTLELGIIGPGGRGRWLCNLFAKHTPTRIAAAADYFGDRVGAARKQFKIPADRCFSGSLSAHKRLLDLDIDAVAIQTPPCFHPGQAADAVAAGKHVYVAKPIAVDVPGCQSILASGKQATAKKLVFLVDFQTRANPFYIETVKRVQRGDLGAIVMVDAHYHGGRLGHKGPMKGPEGRLRNWHYDIALSGDIIVEQFIHALDVATWFLDAEPVRAAGTGGRKARFEGDCYDHFAVTYWFPDGLSVAFSGTQCISGHGGIFCKVYGPRGTAHTQYGGWVGIRAKGGTSYKGGNTGPIYQQGAVTNMKAFHQAVAEGDVANETVAPSVRSNLTCILGREAAYADAVVTYADVLKKAEKLDPKLGALEA
ncbi:MAG: Gfo/Idh/MocA family protein [Planctomycetota bacterium]